MEGKHSDALRIPASRPIITLLYLVICTFNAAAISASAAGVGMASPSDQEAADMLFQHWKRVAHAMPRGKPARNAMLMTDEQLEKLAMDYGCQHPQIWRWHAANRSLSFRTRPHPGQSQAMEYRRFLNISVFDNPAYAGKFTRDFAFYFEAADAFIAHPDMRHLQLPILTNSRSPTDQYHDPYSLPAADQYMGIGLFRWLTGGGMGLTYFHHDAWKIFGFDVSVPEWKDKKPEVVYRGTSWYLNNPLQNYDPSLLREMQKIRVNTEREAKANGISNVCCTNCHARPDTLPCHGLGVHDMITYRYQLNIDGMSACWEAAFWKYSSGSAVIYVLPSNKTTGEYWQPWALWWYPVLKPGVHYMPATAKDFPKVLAELKARPDGGQSMGQAAAEAMRKGANPAVAVHYHYLLMKHIYDSIYECTPIRSLRTDASGCDN